MILNDLVMAAGSGYYYYYLPDAATDAFPVHPLQYQLPRYCHYSYYSKVAIKLAEVITGSAIIATAVTDFATDAKLPIVADSASADSTQHSAVGLLQD